MQQGIQKMEKIINTLIIASTISISLYSSHYTYIQYRHNRDLLISKDIQIASEKGIDPLAVRCAYSQQDDNVCLVIAVQRKNEQLIQLNPQK